jgi:hypothetical protein
VNDEHILALIEAINWTNFNAVHVFAADAKFSHNVGHRQALDSYGIAGNAYVTIISISSFRKERPAV